MVTQRVTKSTSERLVFSFGNRDSYRMNENWPQQERFCKRVEEFARAKGLITPRGALMLDPLSDLFRCSPNTLKQWLQNKKRDRPAYENLAYIAEVVGCDKDEFLTNTKPPPGVKAEDWAEITASQRAVFLQVLDALLKVPEDQQEAWANEWVRMTELAFKLPRAKK